MQAPLPPVLVLAEHRVRCTCGAETSVLASTPWYRAQARIEVHPTCAACGRDLGGVAIPAGSHHEVWPLDKLPASRAQAVSRTLLDEVRGLREADPPEPELGLEVARWCLPHQASADYATWKNANPGPRGVLPPPRPLLDRVDAVALAVLVAIVGVCAVV